MEASKAVSHQRGEGLPEQDIHKHAVLALLPAHDASHHTGGLTLLLKFRLKTCLHSRAEGYGLQHPLVLSCLTGLCVYMLIHKGALF